MGTSLRGCTHKNNVIQKFNPCRAYSKAMVANQGALHPSPNKFDEGMDLHVILWIIHVTITTKLISVGPSTFCNDGYMYCTVLRFLFCFNFYVFQKCKEKSLSFHFSLSTSLGT